MTKARCLRSGPFALSPGPCQGFASMTWFSQGTNFEMLV